MTALVIGIILALGMGLFVNSYLLCILLNRKIPLWGGVKLFSVASALNKLLLTGSGYAALAWKMKGDDIPLDRSLPAFASFELCSTVPWIILGLYFGADVAVQTPLIIVGAMIFLSVFWFFRKRKIPGLIKEGVSYLRGMSAHIVLAPVLILLNVCSGAAYYYFLSKIFAMNFSLLEMARIFSVSFAVGYLSPVPSGLGIKESGVVFLLSRQGVPLRDSIYFAVADRMITTGFYLTLGFLFGAGMITGEMRRRVCQERY
jgi:uncharacterized membrane protein YbhN (UPF0104 family)